MTTLSPQGFPDISAPMVDDDGRLTPVWAIFLQSVFLRTGAAKGGDLTAVTAIVAGLPAQMLLLADDDGAVTQLAATVRADEAAASMVDDDTAGSALALTMQDTAAMASMSDTTLDVREVSGAASTAYADNAGALAALLFSDS